METVSWNGIDKWLGLSLPLGFDVECESWDNTSATMFGFSPPKGVLSVAVAGFSFPRNVNSRAMTTATQ
jgi:hypothetical protein